MKTLERPKAEYPRGPLGNDTAPNARFSFEFDELDELIETLPTKQARRRLKRMTEWAVVFFKTSPSISQIAAAVTEEIDANLLAVNNWTRFLAEFNLRAEAYYIDPMRARYDRKIRTNARHTFSTGLTCKIPGVLFTTLEVMSMPFFCKPIGRCEEHARIALYLLTVGQMAQNARFGRLKGDVYFCGAATEHHAVVVLVKGEEFKRTVLRADKVARSFPKIAGRWITLFTKGLYTGTETWGENAWVIDGWKGESKKLREASVMLDEGSLSAKKAPYVFSVDTSLKLSLRDPAQHALSESDVEHSEYDFTIEAMAKRVLRDKGW